MRVLYSFSTVAYYAVYYTFSYRKTVVIQNVSRSFPDKKYQDIEKIVKDFYRSFTDYFAEIIKTFSISRHELVKKADFYNLGSIGKQIAEGKNVFVFLGHCGNWEMLNILPGKLPYQIFAVYKPLKNKIFDKIMRRLRSRFGVILIPDKSIVKHILSDKAGPSLYLFLADQCPVHTDMKYCFPFLNQQTYLYSGVEKLARAKNSAAGYLSISQTTRGHYRIEFIPICENSGQTQETEISGNFIRLLEQNIIGKPHGWLWSHRRWKR